MPRRKTPDGESTLASAPGSSSKTQAFSIFDLRIFLIDSQPEIWRRVKVKSDISLAKLHDVIQVSMGWEDYHLHHFVSRKGVDYGPILPNRNAPYDGVNEKKVRLCDVISRRKARLFYEYDFGDSWGHGIELSDIAKPEPGVHYPVCVEGQRACPPEDCGGIWGYQRFLEAVNNPKHPDHQEYRDWFGDSFNADKLDLESINKILHSFR